MHSSWALIGPVPELFALQHVSIASLCLLCIIKGSVPVIA